MKYALLTLVLALAGCTAGPDFKRPSAPEVAGYTATPVAVRTESAAVRLGASGSGSRPSI